MKNSLRVWLALIAGSLGACDYAHLYHVLTVENGSGSGEYPLGRQILIEAAPADTGAAFFAWEGDTAFLEAVRAPQTLLTMPMQDVTVRATYRNLPRYSLEVVHGTGDGTYLAGTRVRITAVPSGNDETFVRWKGDTLHLERRDTAVTYVLIPEASVRVEAEFVEIPKISFSREVRPIILLRCSTSNCHGQDREPFLLTYEQIRDNASAIRNSIINGQMPAGGLPLPAPERELILKWIAEGTLNN